MSSGGAVTFPISTEMKIAVKRFLDALQVLFLGWTEKWKRDGGGAPVVNAVYWSIRLWTCEN